MPNTWKPMENTMTNMNRAFGVTFYTRHGFDPQTDEEHEYYFKTKRQREKWVKWAGSFHPRHQNQPIKRKYLKMFSFKPSGTEKFLKMR